MDAEKIVSEVAALSPVAAGISADHAEAISAERDAAATLLAAAIEAARPALRAICSRFEVAERTYWPENTCSATEHKHHDQPGLWLTGGRRDDKPGPQCDHPRANAGAYEGWDLYLLRDGSLVELEYSGSWSRWQGAVQHWDAAVHPVTARAAMDSWDLTECLTRLRDALSGVTHGKAPARAKAARERAAKLSALVALLK